MDAVFSREDIHEMASRWMARPPQAHALRIVTDTSDFFRLETGDVLLLGGNPYLMRSSVREARFGLDDEVKHWVKRAIDLVTGQTKIVKLVFYEQFTATIGGIVFECFRSPRKEARILELVNDHPGFMHGLTVPDDHGNLVRVMDYIYGDSLAGRVADIDQDHEAYFFETLPAILADYLRCVEAVRFLHEHGEKHGDIRRDHILIDADSGHYRWIDFDYNYRHRENIYGYDLFGLGNVLIYVVGKGDVLLPDLRRRDPDILPRLADGDLNIVFHNRVANLKKVFPYIPDSLNRVLLHFSRGTNWFYEHTTQLIQDLQLAMAEIR
jgi:serine/threonine protein kinase